MSTDSCLNAAIRSVGKRPFFDGGRFVTPEPFHPWHLILPRIFSWELNHWSSFPRFRSSIYPSLRRAGK